MEGAPAPSLELVAKAITSLYNSPDCTEKADASRSEILFINKERIYLNKIMII